ncbi:transporter [Winogradskyella sp. KYW1333]|uniref:transporter n=1 Tax=Winogradskyella sp. KYW1333 TaxID=2282123 RepID=UPI000DF41A66|nr:transporter [Winogradskyella sp. KYW1333]RCT54128.1 transporter [Winogradskyella sp. KYW1333]
MKILRSLLTLLISFSFFTAFGQYTEVINSNRPGVSESAFSVGTGILQFEAGAFTVKEEHTPLNYEVGGFGLDFSIRYGVLFEQLEFSLDGIYQNDKITFNNAAIPVENKRSNFKNFTLGAKYLVYDPYKNAEDDKPNLYSYHANRKFKWKSLIPAVAVYVGANYDSDPNPYTATSVEGFSSKVMIATQNNFNGGWVFVMNLIQDRIGSDDSIFQYVLTLTHSFNPKWVIFGEAQGINSDFYADNIFRVGGAYLWDKDFQLDANIAFNTKDTPSVFNIAFGASYRLDFHKDKKIDNGY